MKPEGEREEWLRLFGGLSEGTLTDGEHRRLQEILSGRAEARRLWFLHCDLEHGLARWSSARRAAATVEPPNVIRFDPAPAGRRHSQWHWRWGLAMAAGLMILALVGAVFFRSSRANASPAELTQWALAAHGVALDRCYRVVINPEVARRVAAPARETRLWTRGDRFWNECRVGERTAVWGRDEQGRVWFAVSPELGGLFDVDELPERLAAVCELRSLQPESLLRSLLADFDLRREPDAAGGYVVHAELKPGHEHPHYRAVLLEIDSVSGVLRRVEVERVFPVRPSAHVSFILAETGLRDDASYTLAGHLSEQAVVCDRYSDFGQRARALAEFFSLLRGQAPGEPSPTQTH